MKMSKKIIAVLLSVLFVAGVFAACSSNPGKTEGNSDTSKVKIGFICLHDENSTYDLNFINAAKEAIKTLGLTKDQYIIKTNVPEDQQCADTAKELIDAGCNLIFADSFGHESFLINVAKEYPDVQFCHATGTRAHTEGLDNYHNAFASIYEGRYLAGVAAGMKINQMIEEKTKIGNITVTAETAKIGYVGAHPYAEVKSGYTSFYLGAKSVCPTVTMEVTFTGEWYHEAKEKEAATKLINDGCILISQHADSMGAPTACETAGVPNVSYNGSTVSACPNTFIVSSAINWAPYFEYIITQTKNGEAIDKDWIGTLATNSVVLSDINEKAAAPGTADKIAEVKAQLEAGTLHVFDTSTFTVKGKTLTSYKADVDTDDAFTPDTEVIADGYFNESAKEMRSAPYFDIDIDGITDIG
ncbi:MAG: BMP family ABC transporter substrate-binding protein [Eubacterium sp.]|nr:BMP family ABC transporter substrate-binding protein [Eubacterium sp.]